MINAKEYRIGNEKLLTEYEYKVRKWLYDNGKEVLSEKIPFFRDGITCPEVWFEEGNDFRPLFILKEVSLGIDEIKDLDEYLETWGNQKHFEFVENPFDDVKIGKFAQWRRIAKLAKGLKEIHSGADRCDYYKYDLGYKKGGEKYLGEIKGYKDYNQRTANIEYNDIINRIAILEIKKIGGGTKANSELSKGTEYYTLHIEPFKELLYQQIKLINPTVIICLGREDGKCISEKLKDIKEKTDEIIWIDGYHHVFSSNDNFYYQPIECYKKLFKR